MKQLPIMQNYDQDKILGMVVFQEGVNLTPEDLEDMVLAPCYTMDNKTGKIDRILGYGLIKGSTYDKRTYQEKFKDAPWLNANE